MTHVIPDPPVPEWNPRADMDRAQATAKASAMARVAAAEAPVVPPTVPLHRARSAAALVRTAIAALEVELAVEEPAPDGAHVAALRSVVLRLESAVRHLEG